MIKMCGENVPRQKFAGGMVLRGGRFAARCDRKALTSTRPGRAGRRL